MPLTTKTTLIPHLTCKNALDAVEFYKKAFGATVLAMLQMPDGRLMHAALSIDGAVFHLVEEFPEHGGNSPERLGGTPVSLDLNLLDCDTAFARAVDAGCTVTMPLADMFWGDRFGMVKDPFGHSWSIATTIREVSPAELQKIGESMGNAECGVD